MRKKLDAIITILCLLVIALLPILRSGNLPQILRWITRFDMTGLGLRGVLGMLLLGVQAVPAFWLACFAKHYVTNMLITIALALLVITVRKVIQTKSGEVHQA